MPAWWSDRVEQQACAAENPSTTSLNQSVASSSSRIGEDAWSSYQEHGSAVNGTTARQQQNCCSSTTCSSSNSPRSPSSESRRAAAAKRHADKSQRQSELSAKIAATRAARSADISEIAEDERRAAARRAGAVEAQAAQDEAAVAQRMARERAVVEAVKQSTTSPPRFSPRTKVEADTRQRRTASARTAASPPPDDAPPSAARRPVTGRVVASASRSTALMRSSRTSTSSEGHDPTRALREAEARLARKQRVAIAERNAGVETYGATRSPAYPGWQAARPNSAGFGARDARFAAFWRDPRHKDPTPHVGGPCAYEPDQPGMAHPSPSIQSSLATSKNPFRYGEMHGLRRATSDGCPEINDWWCDLAKEGCLRPTARAAHGAAYPPGEFWYRENLCVCEHCYRRGLAEDCHGHSGALDRLPAHVADGWLLSEYHKYLGFAGAQCRRTSRQQEREMLHVARGAQQADHRAYGEDMRHEAEAQRASAAAALVEVRAEKAAQRAAQNDEHRRRVSAARAIAEQRAQHVALNVAEVQFRIEAAPDDELVVA